MVKQDNEKTMPVEENLIPIDQLPVEVKAYKDENGYALVLRSKDKRIGDSKGRLVDNFLVRIVGGDVPKVDGVHAVVVSDDQTRHVPVANATLDEQGRLFVTNAMDGVQRPAATPEQIEKANAKKAKKDKKDKGDKKDKKLAK